MATFFQESVVSLSRGDVCLSCPDAIERGILLPHLTGVIIEEVAVAAGLLLVMARARAPEAACPRCGTVSGRVHSRYSRKLADAAIGGRQVEILLAVRRFFCTAPGCKRKTFAEQVDGLTTRYARKTPLLAGMLGSVAVALAGRPGSRLAASLGVPASRQVMLRLVMATPDPAAATPRVLGVDDFAIRRGQHYGTLLIDCETGARLDLLEGRDAQPLAGWLAAHPRVEVICRDRSGSYADGAGTGAPDAVQVADRFHLWQNLAKAVEKCTAAHRACLADPALPPAADEGPPPADAGPPEPSGKFADRARRNHAFVHGLRAEGRGIREIALHLGWGQHTVQRYDRAATWQELVDGRWKAPRAGKLDPFKPYLDQHAGEGHGSFTRLFREIRDLGYDGSYSVVRNYLDQVRPAKAPLAEAPPTVRDVTNWLCRRPDTLTEDERPRLKAHPGPLSRAAGRIRPGPRLRHYDHRPHRPGPAALDGHGPRGRAARDLLLRQGTGAGPPRRHPGPDHELELRPCRRTR
jgi:Transposase/zinc-finger of transposase IS204/IS1001/IS1096/IS1165